MAPLKARAASIAAMLLYWLAIVIIRAMQRLYNHRLLSYTATDHFFRLAKRLERKADRLAGRETSPEER